MMKRRTQSGLTLPIGVILLLLTAPLGAQKRTSPFVEGGPDLEWNSPPFSVDGIGGELGIGVLLPTRWSLGFNAEWMKNKFNEAAWSCYSVRVARTQPLTARIGLAAAAAVGRFGFQEHGLHRSAPGVAFEFGVPVETSSGVSVAPMWRLALAFERDGPGALTTMGIRIRWHP